VAQDGGDGYDGAAGGAVEHIGEDGADGVEVREGVCSEDSLWDISQDS
jgi:hypothetical protein